MKSVKFFGLCAITLLLSVFVSCTGNLSQDDFQEKQYGSITIDSGSTSRYLDVNTISKASVTVEGYKMKKASSKGDVEISGGKGSSSVYGIQIGTNRVVSVIAKDSSGKEIQGVVMRALIEEVIHGHQNVTVNWSTTPLGNLYYELLTLDYDITKLAKSTAETYLPKGVSAALIDTKKLAQDIVDGKTPVADDYKLPSRTVTFTVNHESEDVSVYVDDRSSKNLKAVTKGTNVITDISAGKWKMYFFFKGTQILAEQEIDLTENNLVIEDEIKLQLAAPRMEDANGNGLALSTPFAEETTVFLKARSYDDEKISDDIQIYYTTDGTEPTVSSNKFNNETGLKISSNTTVKAFAVLEPYYTSEISVLSPKVRCAAPQVVDASGNPYSELNFNSETTVYLKAAAGSSIKYFIGDSEAAQTYTSEGIRLSQKTTIRAYASLEGYEDSIVTSFGVNVTLPIGTLSITGTTAANRRFKGSNTISITSDSNISGLTIYYTTDGETPGIDRYGNITGSVYTEPFIILNDSEISAIAYKDGWKESEVAGPVKFIRATKLSTPVISGETSFVSDTTVTISYPGTEKDVEIYYCFNENAPAEEIISQGILYEGPFTITESTFVKAVAVLEDYVDSDVCGNQFTITEGVKKVNFISSPSENMTGKSCWVRIWTEGYADATWQKAKIINANAGAVEFNMPTDKTTFLVVITSENTTLPDWEAITYTDAATGDEVDMDGRIFFQTNMNGIRYYENIREYSSSFQAYTPETQVKIPSVEINAEGKVVLASATTAAKIYYTIDGRNPVDEAGSPVASATLYTEPFTLAPSVTTIKVAAYKENYTTSEIKIYSTTGELDVTWYVGVPAKISLPDEDNTSLDREVTVEGMKIALNGNGYNWKEFSMMKCENSSNSSVVWYKLTVQFNSKNGALESLTTYQPRIQVSGQTKTVLYYHPSANGYCSAGVNANVELSKNYAVIDGTNMEDWNFYTSDTPDISSGSAKYYTQDWTVTDPSKIQFTNTDPAYN